MTRNDRNEDDYLPDGDLPPGKDESTGCQAGVCILGGRRSSNPQKGPISFLYPAAAIVAALLLLMMAVV
ncbi:MAG TPA: hypothetical protein VGM27_29430 [Acidobacteriaceae bacterium]|jgi:hypothetical protein